MASKTPRSEKPRSRVNVPEEQWAMPVTYTPDGSLVSLREYIDATVPALPYGQLTARQRAELTAERIERKSIFDVAAIGVGVIDRKRAMVEVRARSPFGRTLIEIEGRVIANVIGMAQQQR